MLTVAVTLAQRFFGQSLSFRRGWAAWRGPLRGAGGPLVEGSRDDMFRTRYRFARLRWGAAGVVAPSVDQVPSGRHSDPAQRVRRAWSPR